MRNILMTLAFISILMYAKSQDQDEIYPDNIEYSFGNAWFPDLNNKHQGKMKAGYSELTLNSIADTYIAEITPQMYYGGDPSMVIGKESTGELFHSLIKFDISAIPNGAIIDNAILKLFYGPFQYEVSARVYPIGSNWEEDSTNWDSCPVLLADPMQQIITGTGSYLIITVIDFVQAWYENIVPNFGFFLWTDFESLNGNFCEFYTKEGPDVFEPELIITYHLQSLPDADFEGFPSTAFIGQPIQFTDLSTGDPNSWSWSFPGGDPASYDGQYPQPISYSDTGYYDVTLVVSNQYGEDDTTKYDYIHIIDSNYIVADFSSNTQIIQVGQNVSFNDLSYGNPSPNNWNWNFAGGNPGTSNLQNPIVTYDSIGSFEVCLIVSNDDGMYDTLCIENYITVEDTVPNIYSLTIGDLVIYFDVIDTNGNIYKVSGNVNINHILKFAGELDIKLTPPTISGNCLIFIDNIPGFDDTIQLYHNNFNFDVIENTIANPLLEIVNNLFTMAGLNIHIESITLLEDGISISGNIKLPEIMGGVVIDIENIQLTESQGLDFIGEVNVDTVKVFNTVKLDTLGLTFNTLDTTFSGAAGITTPVFGFSAGVHISNAQLEAVSCNYYPNPDIPIGSTGLALSRLGASVDGISYPPLVLSLGADVRTVTIPFVGMTELFLSYTWKTSFSGGGKLTLFETDVASVLFEVSHDLFHIEGLVSLTPDYNFLEGFVSASVFNDPPQFEGEITAKLQIPEFTGFPAGLLNLPLTIARTENLIRNTAIYGNFSLPIIAVHYSLVYENSSFSSNFGLGWENWNLKLFDPENLSLNPELMKVNPLEGRSYILSDTLSFNLSVPTKSMVLRLKHSASPPVISFLTPDSISINQDNIDSFEYIHYIYNESANSSYFIFENPLNGTWVINYENTHPDSLDICTSVLNAVLVLDSLRADNSTLRISWNDDDKDSDAEIDLYYDTDNTGADGFPIATDISEDDLLNVFNWDISGMASGIYYSYGFIYDTTMIPCVSYAPNSIKYVNPGAPEKPFNLMGSVQGDTCMYLSWECNDPDTTITFNVYYASEREQLDYRSPSYNIGTLKAYAFSDFIPGKEYRFMVTSMNEDYLESDYSNFFILNYQSTVLNNAPVIQDQVLPSVIMTGTTMEHQLLCSDPDDDPLSFQLVCLKGNEMITGEIGIDQNGVISWLPDGNDIGFYSLIAYVEDDHGLVDSIQWFVTVLSESEKNRSIKINSPVYSCYGGECFITVEDQTLATSANAIDSIHIVITSEADPFGVTITARESNQNSKMFTAVAEFSMFNPGFQQIKVDSLDVVEATYINNVFNDTVSDFCYFKNEPFCVNLVIEGDTSFCAGDPIDITLDPGNFAAYLWSDGLTKSRTLHVTEPGIYWVSVVSDKGCVQNSDTIYVIPMEEPQVNLSASDTIVVCYGHQLDPGEFEFSTFKWNTGDTSNKINIYNTGLYWVEVTNPLGCKGSDTVFISEIEELPAAQYSFEIIEDNTFRFCNLDTNSVAQLWEFGDGSTSELSEPIYHYESNGHYELTLIVYSETCGSDTVRDSLFVNHISDQFYDRSLSIQPNPTKGLIMVRFINPDKGMGDYKIRVLDIRGIEVLSDEIYTVMNDSTLYYNLIGLPRGVYVFCIFNDKFIITERVILN